MLISQREVRGITIVDLEGRLVLEDGVTTFVDRLNSLIHFGHKRILVNFDRVTYLDSAGVGAIAWKFVTAQKRNADVRLLHLRPRSHTVLNTTRLLTVIRHFESEDEAIASFDDQDDDETNPIFS